MRLLPAALTLSLLVFGGMRIPGKYGVVVVFDRWGGCYLYSGVYLMAIGADVKETLRPLAGRAMQIHATHVHEPLNPGGGVIERFRILGAAPKPIDGLRLQTFARFYEPRPELILRIENTSSERREIEMSWLAPTLFAKKPESLFWGAVGEKAEAILTRTSIEGLSHGHAFMRCVKGDVQLSEDTIQANQHMSSSQAMAVRCTRAHRSPVTRSGSTSTPPGPRNYAAATLKHTNLS